MWYVANTSKGFGLFASETTQERVARPLDLTIFPHFKLSRWQFDGLEAEFPYFADVVRENGYYLEALDSIVVFFGTTTRKSAGESESIVEIVAVPGEELPGRVTLWRRSPGKHRLERSTRTPVMVG